MDSTTFDTLTRLSSRRTSLLALSGVGLASALSGAFGTAAKPKAGKAAKKKFKTRCKAQVGQCLSILNVGCGAASQPEECKETFLPCCDFLATCNGVKLLECVLTGQLAP